MKAKTLAIVALTLALHTAAEATEPINWLGESTTHGPSSVQANWFGAVGMDTEERIRTDPDQFLPSYTAEDFVEVASADVAPLVAHDDFGTGYLPPTRWTHPANLDLHMSKHQAAGHFRYVDPGDPSHPHDQIHDAIGPGYFAGNRYVSTGPGRRSATPIEIQTPDPAAACPSGT